MDQNYFVNFIVNEQISRIFLLGFYLNNTEYFLCLNYFFHSAVHNQKATNQRCANRSNTHK